MRILLLGAGFSHNWGGWLSDEVFEYLLGHPEIVKNEQLREKLWNYKDKGSGFEGALAEVQQAYLQTGARHHESDKNSLQAAVLDMFKDMNSAFETKNEKRLIHANIEKFLASFDAIFTLNQDLLLERHYHCGNNISYPPMAVSPPQITMWQRPAGIKSWTHWHMPGVKHPDLALDAVAHPKQIYDDWIPQEGSFREIQEMQPYYKLHGSYNWRAGDGQQLLVIGGNKSATIQSHSILKWYHEQFESYLSHPEARLIVIGYGFRDEHINQAILKSSNAGHLKMFVIDAIGANVLDNTMSMFGDRRYPSAECKALRSIVFGASRRPLIDSFTTDQIENAKIMRFLQSN